MGASRWSGVAVTVTLEEPDRRRSRVSGLVMKPALAGVDRSICGGPVGLAQAPGRR